MASMRRRYPAPLLWGAGVLLATATLHAEVEEAAGIPEPPPAGAPAIQGRPVPPLFFGLNGITPFHHLHSSDPETRDRLFDDLRERLALMHDAGARLVRVDMWWGSIETDRGRFEWDFPDRILREIIDAGLEPYPILTYNSAWSPEVSPATERERHAFAEFAHQAAARNRERVTYWEIWNEPNITPYWVPGPDPQDYGGLLAIAHDRIREANPDAIVAGMATAGPDLEFIEGAYRAGAAGHMEALSFHFYNSTPDESIIEEDYHRIVRLMERYGDAGKPVHITESGLTTGPSGVVAESTPAEQARWVVKRHLVMLAEGVEQFHYYKLMDDPAQPPPDGWWGLLEYGGNPKPAMNAYTAMVERTGGAEYLGRLHGIAVDPARDPEVEFQLYRQGAGLVAAAWVRADGERLPIRLPAAGPVEIESMDGTSSHRVQPGVDSHVVLDLTPEPLYLRSLGPEVAHRLAVRAEPDVLHVYPGESRTVAIRLRNVTEEPLEVSLEPVLEAFSGTPVLASLAEELEEPVLSAEVGGTAEAALRLRLSPAAQPFEPIHAHVRLGADHELSLSVYYDEPFAARMHVEERGASMDAVLNLRNRRGEPANGSIRWLVNGLPKAGASPFAALTAASGQEHRRAFQPMRTGETVLVAEVSDDEGITAREAFRLLSIPAMEQGATVDGDLSEWVGIDGVRLSPSRQQHIPDPIRSPVSDDLYGATVRLAWDEEHLYLAAEISDPTPRVNPFHEGEVWRGDSMELFLGFDGPTTATEYGPDHFQLGLSPGGGGEQPFVYSWRTGQEGGGRVLRSARIASAETDSGYTMEAAIPFAELGGYLVPGQAIGLDLHVSYRSDPEEDEREAVLIWNGTERNFLDPSRWGVGILMESR